uniref:Helicase ATP-binding domain-containing protein n=1 Tax=Strongyloides stercoralis TaxID=6248 RepID=A0AAF5DLT5_STRER
CSDLNNNNNNNLKNIPDSDQFSKEAIDNIQDLEILMKYAFNVPGFKKRGNLIKLAVTSPNLFANKINVILISPESFISNSTNGLISSLYETNNIKRIIIDEAHLIFQCGLTYRPDYLKLLKYLSKLSQLQVLFSSGTLTKEGIIKISNNINSNNYLMIRGCSFKSNILIYKIYKENLIDLKHVF